MYRAAACAYRAASAAAGDGGQGPATGDPSNPTGAVSAASRKPCAEEEGSIMPRVSSGR